MTENVVLLTVDSLRADYCGFVSDGRATTPRFDRRVDESVVFESAISPGTGTAYSMPAAFTGVDTIADVEDFETHRAWLRWHMSQFRSIPEWFAERGYETIGFSPNPYTSRAFGFHRGFDHFEDFLGGDSRLDLRGAVTSRWVEGESVDALRFGLNMVGLGDLSTTWERYYDAIVERVNRASEPFFLWVFLLEPHWPYRPPSRYREPSRLAMYRHNWRRSNASSGDPGPESAAVLRSLYEGTIRHVDEFVDRLAGDLAAADPAYVLHGDHGEAFGEHGVFGHTPHTYEENVRVPLVVWNTGESATVESPVSLTSLPALLGAVAESDSVADPGLRTTPVRATAVDSGTDPQVTEAALRWPSLTVRRTSERTSVYALGDGATGQPPAATITEPDALGDLFDGRPRSERQLIASNADVAGSADI